MLRWNRDLLHDDLLCATSAADPLFLLRVGVVGGFGFSILQVEAGVVSDLLACDAVFLSVNLDDFLPLLVIMLATVLAANINERRGLARRE